MSWEAGRVAAMLAVVLVLWTSSIHPLYGHPPIGQPRGASGVPRVASDQGPASSAVPPAHADHCYCHVPWLGKAVMAGCPAGQERSGLVTAAARHRPLVFGRALDHPPQLAR